MIKLGGKTNTKFKQHLVGGRQPITVFVLLFGSIFTNLTELGAKTKYKDQPVCKSI